MNEELLRELHKMLGGGDENAYNEFKNEFVNSPELQRESFRLLGGGTDDEYNGFLTEIGIGQLTAQVPTKKLKVNKFNESTNINWANNTVDTRITVDGDYEDDSEDVVVNVPKVSSIKKEIKGINEEAKYKDNGLLVNAQRPRASKTVNGYSWDSGQPLVTTLAAGEYSTTQQRDSSVFTRKTPEQIQEAEGRTVTKLKKEDELKSTIALSLQNQDLNSYIQDDVYEDFEGTVAGNGGDDRARFETILDGADSVKEDIKYVVDYNVSRLKEKYDNYPQYLEDSKQVKTEEQRQQFFAKYEEILSDPLTKEIYSFQDKYAEINPFKEQVKAELFKDPEVQKLYEEKDIARQNREGLLEGEVTGVPAIDNTIDVFGRNFSRLLGRTEKMVGGVASLFNTEAGGKLIRRGRDIEELNPKSSIYEGLPEEYIVKVGDSSVVFESENATNPSYVRNPDGTIRDISEEEYQSLADAAKGKERKKEANLSVYGSLIADVASDLIPQILTTKGVGSGLITAGANTKAAYALGAAFSGFAQVKGQSLDALLEVKDLTQDQREGISTALGIGTGLITSINPIEARLASGGLSKSIRQYISKNAVGIANGNISPIRILYDIAKAGALGGAREVGEESAEQLYEREVVNTIANKMYGTSLKDETTADEWKTLAILSFTVGFLADSAGNITFDPKSKYQTQALNEIISSPDLYNSYIEGMSKTNPEQAASISNTIKPIVDEISTLGEDVSQEAKVEIASKMLVAARLEQEIAKIKNPVLRKQKENTLNELYKEITEIELGKKKAADLVEEIEGPTTTTEEGVVEKAPVTEDIVTEPEADVIETAVETTTATENIAETSTQTPTATTETLAQEQEAIVEDVPPVTAEEIQTQQNVIATAPEIKSNIDNLANDNYLFTHVTTEDNARNIIEGGMSISVGTGISSTLTQLNANGVNDQISRLQAGEVVHRDLNNNSVAVISVPKAELDAIQGKDIAEKFELWLAENNMINENGQYSIPTEFNAGYLTKEGFVGRSGANTNMTLQDTQTSQQVVSTTQAGNVENTAAASTNTATSLPTTLTDVTLTNKSGGQTTGTYTYNEEKQTWSKVNPNGKKTPVNSQAQKDQLNALREAQQQTQTNEEENTNQQTSNQESGQQQNNNTTQEGEVDTALGQEEQIVTEQPEPKTTTRPVLKPDEALEKLKEAAKKALFGDGTNAGIAFDPRRQGEMQADNFKNLVNALVDYVRAKIADNSNYSQAEFRQEMADGVLGGPVEIDEDGAKYIFSRNQPSSIVDGIGAPSNRSGYSRTVDRVLDTEGLSDNLKEAVKAGAPPKETITREELKELSDAILAEADSIADEKEAVQAYSELVDEMSESLGNKFKESLVSNERQFMYEIRTLKVIAQRLLDLGQTQKAAEVLNKIARIGSTNGELLAQMATVDNDPDAIFLVNFGKKTAKLRSEVLNSPVNGIEGRTNQEAIDNINKALQEELDATKAELARRIVADVEKSTKARSKPKPTTTSEKIKALDLKAEEYLKKFRDRIASPTFKSVVPGVPSPDMILAAKDFALFAYYKFAGSIVKAKEAFLAEKVLEPVHQMWDDIVADLSKKELPDADMVIAKEKILQAIQDETAKKEFTGINPAQAIARRILRLDQAPKTGKRKGKTIQEKLADNELDQHTINEIRQLVEGDFLTLTPEKRAEVMTKVDDLLYAAQQKSKALRAAPWITKSKIRKDLREGLQSMGQTIEDLVNDYTNIDVYTKTIGEEFISRTGLTPVEAKPYIDIIEANIREFVEEKVTRRLDRVVAEGFQGDIDNLAAAIVSEQKKVDALLTKEKTPAEVKELRNAKQRLRTLQNKRAATVREMERRMKSVDFKKVVNSILKGGLNESTVVDAFAARLGLDVITQEQLRHFEALRQRVEDAAVIINGERKEILKEREDAIKDLKSYIYRIQNKSLLELIRQIFESSMYANVLSSPRTAEVAIFSGLKLLTKDILANAFTSIVQDLARAGKGKVDLVNTRLLLSAIKSMFAGDLKIFNNATMLDVLAGREGITLQQSEISQKGKDRLEATLSMIDKLREQKKVVNESSMNAAAKKALNTSLSLLILQQQIARTLVVGDYISRSAAIPFAAHRNLSALAVESLPSTASARDIYKKIDELIDKEGVEEAVQQKKAAMASTGVDFNKKAEKSYRRRIRLDFLPVEVQNSVKEYADRIAFTGRATGYSGILLNEVNGVFDKINGTAIEAEDSNLKASVKLARSIAANLLKFTVVPFPGVIFRGTQMLKNTTPLGLFQRNINVDPETGKTSPKGLGIKFFNEHRYYGGSADKVLEIIETQPWERSSRIAWSVVPTVGLVMLFSAMFDFEDEDGNKSDDVMENIGSLLGAGNKKIVLPDDNKTLITGDYDTKVKEYYQSIGLKYEPHTIYRKGDDGKYEKLPIIGTYKDDSYGWVLKCIAAVQERLLFGKVTKSEMEESAAKAEYDKLPANTIAMMMLGSAVGFLGEYGLTGAVEKLDFVGAMLSDKPEDMQRAAFVLDQAAKSTVRQVTPLSALGTYLQNVKGMMYGEDKRKGKDIVDGALGNYIFYSDLVEDYDFDALGSKIPYQSGPYGVLGGVENAVASITNEQYTVFNNQVFEERVTNAHRIRAKYSDLSSRVKQYYPSDATSGGSTVIKLGSSSDTRVIAEKAAKYKGEMLNYFYEELDELPKGDLDKVLKSVNDVANQHAYTEYVIDIVSSNPQAMKKLGYETRDELIEAVTTEDASGIGVIDDNTKFYRKSKSPFDKKTDGIVVMLKDANLFILSDKSIQDKDFNKIYETTGVDRQGKAWKPVPVEE